MGIVAKQGLYNSIYTYLGFIIGGIYTVFIVPRVFQVNPEYWGTTRYLISLAMIIVPWVQLSIPSVIIRYFPIFKQKQSKDFLFFILFWTTIGISVGVIVLMLYFKLWFHDEDPLIMDNLYLVFPILLGYVLFEIVTAFSKSFFKTTFPIFLRELLLRVNVMVFIILYWYNIIDFSVFVNLFAFNYVFIFLVLFIYVINMRALKFSVNFKIIFDKSFIPIYTYAAFSIITLGAGMILLNIDVLMLNKYLTLKQVAIYSPSIYVAGAIMIPSRSIQSIITPIVANAWPSNNIKLIKELYIKSAIAPLVFTIYVFLLIWVNIDFLMAYFGEVYGQGKYVILYLSMGYIINIASGINATIIKTSRFYKADLYFQVALVVVAIIMNVIFIPVYGINGAAMATALTLSVHNLIYTAYVYNRFKMHPFSSKTIIVLLLGVFFFLTFSFIPSNNSLLYLALISVIFTVLYWIIIYIIKASEDVNIQVDRLLFRK